MSMTRAQLRTLVEGRTGRTDKTTTLNTLLDLALVHVAQQAQVMGFRVPETRYEATLTPGASAEYVALPTGCQNILHVEFLDPANTTSTWVLPLKSKQWVRERVPNIDALSASRPTVCYRDGANLYLIPVCDVGTYNINISYTKEPAAFASDSTANPLTGFDECVAARATAELFRAVEKFAEASAWDQQFLATLNSAITAVRKSGEQHTYAPFGTPPDGFSPTPWFDPFAQSSR